MISIEIILIKIALHVMTTVHNATANKSICEILIDDTRLFDDAVDGGLANYRKAYTELSYHRIKAIINALPLNPEFSTIEWKRKQEKVTVGYFKELLNGALRDPVPQDFLLPGGWCRYIVNDYFYRGVIEFNPFVEMDHNLCEGYVVPTLFSSAVHVGVKHSILDTLYRYWSTEDIQNVARFMRNLVGDHTMYPIHPNQPIDQIGTSEDILKMPLVLSNIQEDINRYVAHMRQLIDPNKNDTEVLTLIYSLGYFEHVGFFVEKGGYNGMNFLSPKVYCDNYGNQLIR